MKPSDCHPNKGLHNWLVYYYRDKFLQKFSPLYKGQLYDLGCGEAPFRKYFEQYCDKYIGVDWAGSVHETKADIAADLNKPIKQIADAQADTIISISVLEHLCEPQIMLNEAHRILKPGGNIIMQVPWQWMVHEAPYDYFRYSPYGLEYMYKKAGFSDIQIIAECGFFTMWFLKLCYFLKRFVRGPKALRLILQILYTPFWIVFQALGFLLDKLDYSPSLEAGGYYVTATKS